MKLFILDKSLNWYAAWSIINPILAVLLFYLNARLTFGESPLWSEVFGLHLGKSILLLAGLWGSLVAVTGIYQCLMNGSFFMIFLHIFSLFCSLIFLYIYFVFKGIL